MNSIYLSNDYQSRKTWALSYFYEYHASVVSLIFLLKTLIWDKITFPASCRTSGKQDYGDNLQTNLPKFLFLSN